MFDGTDIYTLGTGLRKEEEFIEILNHYLIEGFFDVRSFPRSKLPHFSRGYLEDLLVKSGISYYFLGKELGGLRKGGYESYTETDAFSNAIDQIEKLAWEKRSVIVCAETFPWKCHRRWIARELTLRGWHVIHILNVDKVWEPS